MVIKDKEQGLHTKWYLSSKRYTTGNQKQWSHHRLHWIANRSHLKTQQHIHSRGLQHSHQWPRGCRHMAPTWHHKCLQAQTPCRYTNTQSGPHPQPDHHGKLWRIPSGKDHTLPLHIRPSVYNNAINLAQTQSTTATHQAQENTRQYNTRIW